MVVSQHCRVPVLVADTAAAAASAFHSAPWTKPAGFLVWHLPVSTFFFEEVMLKNERRTVFSKIFANELGLII